MKKKMNFFVHKRDDSKGVANDKTQIVRTSMMSNLMNSTIFNKYKKRDSKNRVKTSIVVDKSNGFANKRKSKTFIENVGFNNHLAVNLNKKMLNDQDEMDLVNVNMLVSMKTIGVTSQKRPSTNTKTDTNSPDVFVAENDASE